MEILTGTYMGGEGRYEDYVYLDLIEREWRRAPSPSPLPQRVCDKISIVVLFWSYFETRIDRLLRTALQTVPPPIAQDLLNRYSGIGSRLDRLYKLIFNAKYDEDLRAFGYGSVADHLKEVQQKRNAFAHGDPYAIDDGIVSRVVEQLKDEHEGWIGVFNERIARRNIT